MTPPSADQRSNARRMTYQAVWETADKYLRNVVEPEVYGDYIMPFLVLRRLEATLAPKKQAILDLVKQETKDGEKDVPLALLDLKIRTQLDVAYYSLSPLDLKTIGATDANVGEAMVSYINSFSSNIDDIWTAFRFEEKIDHLDAAGRLFAVARHFANLDLSRATLPDTVMGDVFEDVMYRAFNAKGKGAGAFYTPRDAISLMAQILLTSDDDDLITSSMPSRSVYDPTAGTGGMLLVMARALQEKNPGVQVGLHGQELMDYAYAIGKADLLIQGGEPDAIQHGDTLKNDLFQSQTFDYVLSNPPYGSDWSAVHSEVTAESEADPDGRFSHGLPRKSDGQMLFLAHVAHKMAPAGDNGKGGRAAIVLNGSPLFSGRPGSGEDRIRNWLLNSDLVDAIIALPTSMFYGTGIATYIWILDNNKQPHRRGKIQLIDASEIWSPIQKGMGDKRRHLAEEDQARIVEIYDAFEDSKCSRILTADDLGFRDVEVFQQRRLAVVDELTDEVWASIHEQKAIKTPLSDEHRAAIADVVGADQEWSGLYDALGKAAKAHGVRLTAGEKDAIALALGVDDEDASPAIDRKGNPVAVEGSKMTERVPLTEDVDEHMRREVLPFAPDSQWDEENSVVGYEIPFTRIFYEPEPVRSLEEIDADIEVALADLREIFQEVKE